MTRQPLSFVPTARFRRAIGRLAVCSVAIATVSVTASLATAPERAVAAGATPSGGFALAGGLGGSVDPRTGQFSLSMPVASADGSGGAGISIGLSWQQGRAAASVDRSGWGAGWTIGSSFVSVTGLKRVYPAGGGSYLLDPTQPSGLKDYLMRDLVFAVKTGTLAAPRVGAAAVAYAYSLTYDDGRVDYFDANGNLAARVDRYGNQTTLTWQARAGGQWRPLTITDSYGLTTTFDYQVANTVQVISPKRSDGVIATTSIALTTANGVQSITDAMGQKTVFGYASVTGAPKPLLTQITASNGAKTAIGYVAPAYEPTLTVVKSLQVTDNNGNPITPAQTFDLDPAGTRHNFTGYPNHLSTNGEDALFDSGDTAYVYKTSLKTGTTTTLNTYDALHRLIDRTVSVAPAVGTTPLLAQDIRPGYAVPVRVPGNLPPNFARPMTTALTQSTATSAQGITETTPRTTTTATSYDDHGRLVSSTDELGTTTTTAYDDRFGVVTGQTTTGDDGSKAQMVNTLTADGRNIATSKTLVGAAGETPTARQTLSFAYNATGQLLTRTLAWAPGAAPAAAVPGGGPATIVTRFARTIDPATATATVVVTVADGTSAAEKTTSTVDLVTDQILATTDALGRTTTSAYDKLGRQTMLKTAAGLTTTVSHTPTSTTTTGPDGRVTRTTTDLFGRTIAVSDNVKNGALTTDPTARTLSATSYSVDGSSVTGTDRLGRVIKTIVDPFGRTVSQTSASGVTQLTSYDTGADHDTVQATVPSGDTSPSVSKVTTYDDSNRAVSQRTSYPTDGLGGRPGVFTDPVVAASFNGLGQTETSTANDLTVTPDRSGPGGIDVSATSEPSATDDFPGQPVTATTVRDLTGRATSRTLQQGSETSEAVAVDYDAAGHIVTGTDPDGRVTRYTYNDNGQPLTKTDPSGTVTTNTYDATTGMRTATSVASPGKTTRSLTFTWVPQGQPGAGQLKTTTDSTGTITYGYDVDGHRTSVTYPDGTSTKALYNDAAQLVSTTDVTGAVTTYTWDTAGRMQSATQKRGSYVLATDSYTYDSLNRMATDTRGNGSVTTTTYSDTNLVESQTTTAADGTVLEAHSYTYDAHKNPHSRTDTYPSGSAVSVPLSGTNTWTTVYKYDAYDRLISSSVYAGPLVNGAPNGIAATITAYTVDLGSDVTTKAVTTRLPGPRPIPVTTTTTNTVDDSGRLTSQQVGSTTTTATYDADGRVLKSLNGNVTTYTADGAPATVTLPNGSKTVYAYWPDGSRRSAKTTGADGRTSSLVFHYGTDGNLVNDSTADTITGAGTAVTASYLITSGREARTLLPGTAPSGSVTDTPQAPITTGGGTGYYLRDRHSSVTSMVDSTGAVTAAYAYSDYGAPARADGQSLKVSAAVGGRANPYTYLGAAPGGPWTSAVTSLLVFQMRTYDPATGRFTSADPMDAHNLYQAFETNPITNADLNGGISIPDIILDCVFAAIFLVSIVLTFGAASAAVGVAAAAFEVGELTAGVVLNAAANIVSLAANVTGAATSAALAADDISVAANGDKHHLYSADVRANLTFANQIATVVGGVTGVVAGFSEASVGAAEEAVHNAKALEDLKAAYTPKNIPGFVATADPNIAPALPIDPAPVIPPGEQVLVPDGGAGAGGPAPEGQGGGGPDADPNVPGGPPDEQPPGFNNQLPDPVEQLPPPPQDNQVVVELPQIEEVIPVPNPVVERTVQGADEIVPAVVSNMVQVGNNLEAGAGQLTQDIVNTENHVTRDAGEPNLPSNQPELQAPQDTVVSNVVNMTANAPAENEKLVQ